MGKENEFIAQKELQLPYQHMGAVYLQKQVVISSMEKPEDCILGNVQELWAILILIKYVTIQVKHINNLEILL